MLSEIPEELLVLIVNACAITDLPSLGTTNKWMKESAMLGEGNRGASIPSFLHPNIMLLKNFICKQIYRRCR